MSVDEVRSRLDEDSASVGSRMIPLIDEGARLLTVQEETQNLRDSRPLPPYGVETRHNQILNMQIYLRELHDRTRDLVGWTTAVLGEVDRQLGQANANFRGIFTDLQHFQR